MKTIFNLAEKTVPLPPLFNCDQRNSVNARRRPSSALEGGRGDEIELIVPRENVLAAVQTIMWRLQTSLPIVRVREVSVYAQARPGMKNQLFHMSKARKYSLQTLQKRKDPLKQIIEYCEKHQQLTSYLVSVRIEDILCRLSEISMLPFAQAIFLLKEMLVGFEALIDIFGFFEPRDSLVAVTPNGQWKLWMDQNFGSQQKKQCILNERDFIYMLISMTENHSLATSQSKSFFSYLKQYTSTDNCTFLKTLEKIHSFVAKNKIYQVSRVIIDQTFTNQLKQQQEQDTKKSNQTNRVIKKTFNNPFVGTDTLRSRSSNKVGHNFMLPKNKSGPFLFKKSNFKDNSPNFLSHNISPILSPMSPGASLQPSFTQLSDKWPSANFLASTQPKPASQISKPQKRPNMRKYSQQQTKLHSFQPLRKQKCANSTISNISFGQEGRRESDSSKPKNKQYSSQKQLQSYHSFQNASLSPQNSSSTKQMRYEDDRLESCNYNSLKKKDLSNNERFKNNKSLITNQPHTITPKQNMTNSHQFSHNKRSESEDEISSNKGREDIWINKISDLFSDTVSIKQLKGSIKLKCKQEEHYEKQYLKDVKLDLLQKFGRKVNMPITISEGEEEYYPRKQEKQSNYRSMQLIEQQLEEVISHVQEDTRLEDMASQSIKSMRSRKYTQQAALAEREISFKDEFIKAEPRVSQSSVFNFQTQMYTINPRHS